MVTIPGASQFLNASTLANVQGVAAQSPTLLGETSTASLLEAGRGLAVSGIGLSSSARALNQQFLDRSADVNALFSLGAGGDATIEGAQQQILALRGRLSDSQLAPGLRSEDNGNAAASDLGQTVNQTA